MVEHVAVLGMHVHDGTRSARGMEKSQKGVVTDRELVDHEHLEAGVPRGDDRGDLGQRGVRDFGEDDVEAVVDVRLALCLPFPRFERIQDRLAPPLPRVIADRGDAAARRGRRARLEVVRGRHAPDFDVQMRVHVDAAGEHEQPSRVDLLDAFRDRSRHGRDPARANAEVRDEGVARGHDCTTPHDHVVRHAISPPRLPPRRRPMIDDTLGRWQARALLVESRDKHLVRPADVR
jgi:hypothetical protein